MERIWSCYRTLLMLIILFIFFAANLLVKWPLHMNWNLDGITGNKSNSWYQITEKDRTTQISNRGNQSSDKIEGSESDHDSEQVNGRIQTPDETVSSDSNNGQISNVGTATKHAITSNGSTGQTMILIWHWPYRNPFSVKGDYCKDHFGISNCIMVANRSQFPEADLVVFHSWELTRGHTEKLPVNLTRPEKQRWVWLSRESPVEIGDLKSLNGYFNLTMTYRRDSDIYTPYGLMVPKQTVSDEPLENFIPKKKTKLACWVVSHYDPKLVRTVVYKKLKTVIPIKVYGKGGNGRIDQKDLIPTISRCYFYLAFENSIYKDYITEKLWFNAYRGGAVPVVLGPSRKDYEAMTDKDSFIHVNDFKTIEELGQFLKDLAQDKERYASYFNWRHKYNAVRKYWQESMCKFCPNINSLPPHKVYDDLDTWFRM